MQVYGPPKEAKDDEELRQRIDAATAKARDWLLTSKPVTTEDKVGHLQPVGMTILLFASHQGAQSGQQLLEGEGLRQIVVAAGVEALDPVVERPAGGEGQDGDLCLPTPQLAVRGIAADAVSRLARHGLVSLRQVRVDRDPFHSASIGSPPVGADRRLTPE